MKRVKPLFLACVTVWACHVLVGCSHAAAFKVSVRMADDAAAAATIVLLKGQKSDLVDETERAFLDSSSARVVSFSNVSSDDAAALLQRIDAENPLLIIALGAQAATFAVAHFTTVPVIFALVLNHNRYQLASHGNVAGISMEPSAQIEFLKFRLVDPNIHRVVVPYTDPQSSDLVQRVTRELQGLGGTVLPVPVAQNADAVEALRKLDSADAIWLINDAWVMKQFSTIRAFADQRKLRLLTSLSATFAHEGAYMSVAVDFEAIGRQLGTIATLVGTYGKAAKDVGVQSPIVINLSTNLDVAKRIGVAVPSELLPYVNDLIETSAQH